LSATVEAPPTSGALSVTVFKRGRRHSTGYQVLIYEGDDGQPVVDYSAGANPHDSQAPGVSSVGTVAKWARQTAIELYKERYGKKPKNVEIEYKDYRDA